MTQINPKTPVTAGCAVLIAAMLIACGSGSSAGDTAVEKNDAVRVCQDKFIPEKLKAPATAKFSNVTAVGSAVSYTVTGSVDWENGFGALIRSTFTCSVHSSGNQWVLDSTAFY